MTPGTYTGLSTGAGFAGRLARMREALPEIIACSPGAGSQEAERERVALVLARSSVPASALAGLHRIWTGDGQMSVAGLYGAITGTGGEDDGKRAIALRRGYHEHGDGYGSALPPVGEGALLHEIGHHVTWADGAVQRGSPADEARAENFAFAHAAPWTGIRTLSAYDYLITQATWLDQRSWGLEQVRQYQAERAAGALPGDPLAPLDAARLFAQDDFSAARENLGRRQAQASRDLEAEAR